MVQVLVENVQLEVIGDRQVQLKKLSDRRTYMVSGRVDDAGDLVRLGFVEEVDVEYLLF